MNEIGIVPASINLRFFTDKVGRRYVLKGNKNPIQDVDNPNYKHNYLKLYKVSKNNNIESVKLIAKKDEKLDAKNGNLIKITKEIFNPETGLKVETSEISKTISGGKMIECNGDVFQMSGNVVTNRAKNTPKIHIDMSKGELTPMAKRILNILKK